MAFCQSCGTENAAGNTFCVKCGTRLTVPPAQQAQYVQPMPPMQTAPPMPYSGTMGMVKDNKGSAITSFVLGLVSLFIWLLPYGVFIAFITSILGIIMGAVGMKSSSRGLATAGLVLSIIALVGLILIVVLIIIGVSMLASGGYI